MTKEVVNGHCCNFKAILIRWNEAVNKVVIMRVLIVEDETLLCQQLREFFTRKGFAVDTASTAEEGLYFGTEYPLDLAVIDLGLPDFSGLELIERLRAQGKEFPILILTARGRWQEKVQGLEGGADDYLVKPFHYEELWARINALLRRAVQKGDI